MKKEKQFKMDEEFETLLQEFVEEEIDFPNEQDESTNNDDQSDDSLPFPREMDARVANTMMKANDSHDTFMDDVAKVSIEIAPDYEKGYFWNAPVVVTFYPKRKGCLKQKRFKCFIYDEAFLPVCCPDEDCRVERTGKNLTIEMPCYDIWMPGKFVLLINDNQSSSVVQVDFMIDDDLNTTQCEPRLCPAGGKEDMLINCIQEHDVYWDRIAHMPGFAQFRRKAIESRHLQLYNECRREKSLDEINSCNNLLICTRNDDIDKDILKSFLGVMAFDGRVDCIDCATLYDLACNNPFEPMSELINDTGLKMLCLTNLKELMSSNGKVIMRRIIEKVRDYKGRLSLWLCGSRYELDEMLNLFPSIRQFFLAESWVCQEPYTNFEFVQAFFNEIASENMEPNVIVKDRLTRVLLQNYKQGLMTNWSMADMHRFVIEEIRPRYLRRVITQMFDDFAPVLKEEDIPFEKLTSSTSAFAESIRDLNEMIGLESVKQGIMTMANQTRLFQERRRRGLKTSNEMVFHCIFTGNPGTGKTTVARKLGKIYHALGLLSKGEVISVDRTRLVGQYIGQTEENMKVVLEEAKGNVLFIDEAYTLVTGTDDKRDFGRRVLDSLLTVLTQPNPDMLIIFAGYPKEMDMMLSTNPGLSGRFPFRYHFDDYSAEQLMEIARRLFERDEYILTDEADVEMQKSISITLGQRTSNFGNARWIDQFVRNGVISAMADRVYTSGCNNLQLIEAVDITKAFEKFKPKPVEQKPTRHIVAGFNA